MTRTVNIEAYRAINAAHYAQGRKIRFGASCHKQGYRVSLVEVTAAYSIPSVRPKYAHLPRFAWIAWDRGRPVLMRTHFACGGQSWTARGEAVTHLPVCPRCPHGRGRGGMTEPTLFDGYEPIPDPYAGLSADRKRTLRQHQMVEAGIHPLTRQRVSPATTSLYDMAKTQLDRNATHQVAGFMAAMAG